MNLLARLEVRLQLIEERQKLARTLSLRVPDVDVAGLGVERAEQTGGAATQVVVRTRLGAASDGRQRVLRHLQGLDLRLHVHRDHQRTLGKIDEEHHDIVGLLLELRISRHLEDRRLVELDVMPGKYLLHRAGRQTPHAIRQYADGPFAHTLRGLGKRELQQPVHLLLRHPLPSRRPPRLMQQALDALREKSFPPAPYGLFGASRLTRCLAKPVVGRQPQNDLRPPHVLLHQLRAVFHVIEVLGVPQSHIGRM